MPDFAGGFAAAARFRQLVVTPERAVDEDDIRGFGSGPPRGRGAGKRGSKEEALLALLHDEANSCFVGRERTERLFDHVIRIRASERHCGTDEFWRRGGVFGEMTAQTSSAGQSLPFHRRIGTLQNAEYPVFFLENALHARSREHKEALKLAQMEKAHYRINVGARQEHAPNRRWSRIVLGWRELRGSEHLMSQIRRSAEKKPGLGVRREGDLCLRARTAFECAAAQRATVQSRPRLRSRGSLRAFRHGCQ